MIRSIINKFKKKPNIYYAMSIAATWAGVGSLMMGIEMTQNYGIIPFLIWALGNTLACIVFGVVAPNIPKLRDVFKNPVIKYIVGIMCTFQIWLNMNGIQTIFQPTAMPDNFGTVLAIILVLLFIIILFKHSMIRNVLTDHYGLCVVYLVLLGLTIGAIIFSLGNMNELSWGFEHIGVGIEKCILLIPGAFLYPYFFEILDYNEQNTDDTKKINVTKAFVNGGLLFGGYLAFTFLLSWTQFNDVLNLIKAFVIVLIAASTLSSFIYSVYLSFGKKLGLGISIATLALWQILIPLGVMGVWTLMSKIRGVIVIVLIVIALVWNEIEKSKNKKNEG